MVTAQQRVVSLTLPLPPVTNSLYSTVNGRRVKSKAAREYVETVGWETWSQLAPSYASLVGTFVAPLELRITLYLKFDRDVDSCKALQDSLAAAFEFNDAAITRLIIEKCKDKVNPRAEITIKGIRDG